MGWGTNGPISPSAQDDKEAQEGSSNGKRNRTSGIQRLQERETAEVLRRELKAQGLLQLVVLHRAVRLLVEGTQTNGMVDRPPGGLQLV